MKLGQSIQAVLFDLDGTLIDTEPTAARAIRECFLGWGLQVDPEDAAFITGRTWENAFKYLFQKYELPVPAQQASHAMVSRYRELIQSDLLTVPGGVEAIKSLAERIGNSKRMLRMGMTGQPLQSPLYAGGRLD
jgi:beta-phosphoglucomutase